MDRKRWRIVFLGIIVSAGLFFRPVFAAEIVLKTGKTVEGKIVKLNDKDMVVDVEGIELTYAFDAIESVNSITDFSRIKLDDLRQSAFRLRQAGKYSEAADIFLKIKDLDSLDTQNLDNIIDALKRAKRHKESISYIKEKVQKEPNNVEAHRDLGNAYRHDATKEQECLAEYEKVIEMEGPTATNQFDLGLAYRVYDKCDRAIPYFEKSIAMGPVPNSLITPRAYGDLGRCYLTQGKAQEALAACQKAVDLAPQGFAYRNLAVVYEALGQTEKAAESNAQANELENKVVGIQSANKG